MAVCELRIPEAQCDVLNYAHGSATTAWTPVYINAGVGVGIPQVSNSANATGAYYTRGRFVFTITSSITVASGDKLYFDTSANTVQLIPNTTCVPLGIAAEAGNAAGGKVEVLINEFGNTDVLLEKVVTLTNAQVKTLYSAPVSVITAPGAGKAVVVESVLGKLNYADAGFDSVGTGDDFVLKYTNASGGTALTMETTGWLDQTADAYQYGTAATTVKPVANAAVVAHILAGEIYGAAGGGSVTLWIKYRIINLL